MDSSSITKLYLTGEVGTEDIRQVVDGADRIATSLIAYAEVRAAVSAARRSSRLRNARALRHAVADLDRDWVGYFKLGVSSEVVSMAGNLAESHALSGADAIHLASALMLQAAAPDPVSLSTWDTRLWDAANAEGLALANRRPA